MDNTWELLAPAACGAFLYEGGVLDTDPSYARPSILLGGSLKKEPSDNFLSVRRPREGVK